MTFADAGVNLFYVPNLAYLTTPDQQQNKQHLLRNTPFPPPPRFLSSKISI